MAAAECEITIVARANANGTRAKSGGRTVPGGPELIQPYAGYLHEGYGNIDSDYVFPVNVNEHDDAGQAGKVEWSIERLLTARTQVVRRALRV